MPVSPFDAEIADIPLQGARLRGKAAPPLPRAPWSRGALEVLVLVAIVAFAGLCLFPRHRGPEGAAATPLARILPISCVGQDALPPG